MTDAEQKQNALAASKIGKTGHQFREMIDALPVAIYTTDAEGRLTHFNTAAVEFSGRVPELGTDQWCVTWKLYYSDGTPMPHEEYPMAIALKEGRSISGEVAIAERPDGKRIWFESYPSPLRDEEDKIVGGINMLVDITDRKRAEKQLRRSEQELADFFENATLGLHWVGPDGIILKVNQAELDMLGYTREEYVGHSIADFHADQDVIDDILRWLKAGEELHDYEARMRCKDGSIRHVLISSNVYWEDGEFVHTRCFTRDITERRQAVKALRKSEKKYRTLFDSIDEGFCIIEMLFNKNEKPIDYRFLEVNPAFEKQTGLKDVEGKRMRELAPDHEQYWFETYGEVALTGEPVRFENSSHALNRWFDVYAFRIGEPHERKVALLFNDITERKRNGYTNAFLGAIVDGSEDAIISKDLNSVITSWNAGAERLFGYTAEEAIGQFVTMLIPDDRLDEETYILEQVKKGERVEQFETVRICKDGRSLDVSLTISLVRDSTGRTVGASKIVRDITKRKQTEKKLQRMNETLEERVEERTAALLAYQKQLRSLASELSKAEERERQRLATDLHDNLGQMLAVGKMKLDLLQLQKNQLPDRAASGVAELAELMDDAIRYTRELMSNLKPPPSLDKEDLSASIRWVANKMKKHDLEVIIEDDGQPKPLSEEVRTTLRQCVRELLFNVVKHAGVNEARVALSRLDDQVQVIVEDKGKGFNMEEKKPAPTEEGGFGLFNIHERMDLLGGSLEIISEPGKGMKMILHIPVKDKVESNVPVWSDEGTGTPLSGSPEQPESCSKIKVLLVDDHQMMREGLRKMIEEEDDLVVIAEASDGEEGVKLAHEASPDVVVMDVNMPGMNGIDATRKIISDKPQMRIIGLSLQEERHVAQAMRDAGASAYLTKSEVFETLCATIRSEAPAVKE